MIVKGVPLSDSLLGELLVLQVNVLLDVEDVTLGISLCLLLDKLELGLRIYLHLLLLLRQLYLVVVFFLLDDLFEVFALGPPVKELGLELHPLLVGLIHNIAILLQLRQFDFIVSDLLIALPLDVLDLCLKASNYLIVVALILLL